jgi:hypothetical protein
MPFPGDYSPRQGDYSVWLREANLGETVVNCGVAAASQAAIGQFSTVRRLSRLSQHPRR